MKIIETLSEKHILQLHQFYLKEWWASERTLEETHLGVVGSQITLAIIDGNGDLCGFCRVLTDFIFKAFIFDVIVREDQRGNHVGSTLIQCVKQHEKLQQVKHFELYCRPNLISFYQNHGFDAELGNIHLMRISN